MSGTWAIEVERAGLCDLVVDLGRPGFADLGVPAGGAADPGALAAGNRLVGNGVAAAGLEISVSGPVLRFPQGGVLALTGGRFAATRSSGGAVEWNRTLVLGAGETLAFGSAQGGCRCWLSLRGGLAVAEVLGSRSTFLPGGFGGQQGRALRAGDVLAVNEVGGGVRLLRASPPAAAMAGGALRVIAGPQAGGFADAGLAAFFGARYRVTSASDRRGLRLAGPPVPHVRGEMASQGVMPGAVQVPADGQPIILGWDGPVTGGYPVIAGVICADWPRLAQLRPGDAVSFETVGLDVARRLALCDWELEEIG